MKVRPLLTTLAFVAVAAPFAARADAPSGDISTVFKAEQSIKVEREQFDRREYRQYVEGVIPTNAANASVTREEVKRQLATMPQEKVGA